MFADNWGACPKCLEQTGLIGEDIQNTLREDYEMWTDETGLFQVFYECSCKECGLEFKFEHKERLDI